ncbi:MAG TPA: hypothetical protein VGJ94_03145 [Syntrophorhabdaceae bacterium]|jgi:hypothetical protein
MRIGIFSRGALAAWTVILCLLVSPIHAMTPDQMRELPGGDLISSNPETVFSQYGLPAAIIDFGVISRRPVRTLRWGGNTIRLTDDDWTLIYSREGEKRKDPTYWINPGPVMPEKLAGLKSLTLFTYGRERMVIERSRRTNRLVMRIPANLFEAHIVYQLIGVPLDPLTSPDIVKIYGAPQEEVRDKRDRRVLRYRVAENLADFPPNIYVVDFTFEEGGMLADYGIQGVSVDHVREKYRRPIEKFRPGCEEDEQGRGSCSPI